MGCQLEVISSYSTRILQRRLCTYIVDIKSGCLLKLKTDFPIQLATYNSNVMFSVSEDDHLGQHQVENVSWKALPPWCIISES